MTKIQKKLRKRILEIIYEAKASHIGSCISVVDLIYSIYKIKKNEEKFVLSNGHSAVALYAVLEHLGLLSNPTLNALGVHPTRSIKNNIDVSTGSLGQGLPIAVGMALADRSKNVYCIISDGESAEGSIWESLRILVEQNLVNLKVIISANGWGAYDPIDVLQLEKRLRGFGLELKKINGNDLKECLEALRLKTKKPTMLFAQTNSEQLPFLKGLDAHYYSMSEKDFSLAKKELS